MKRLISFFLTTSLMVSFASFAMAENIFIDQPKDNSEELYAQLVEKMDQGYANNLLLTEVKMLRNKLNLADDFPLWQYQSVSNLERDISLFDNSSSSEIDILTGMQAVSESLQIGSVGTDGDSVDLLESAERVIEQYKIKVGEYPASLADFVEYQDEWWAEVYYMGQNYNLSELEDIFDYQRIDNNADISGDEVVPDYSFSLKLKTQPSISIDDVENLDIKSHDYEAMLDKLNAKSQVPAIASLAPADDFFVYFDDIDRFLELKKNFEDISGSALTIYDFASLLNIEKDIFKRLGISDNENFYNYISEFAFVSEDLSFTKRTDFAVIVKFKDKNSAVIAKLLENGENAFGEIGDYYVLATSKEMLQKIQDTQSEDLPSLAKASDFIYMTAVLDQRKDGIVYLSEQFIRKLTSVEYRINARRKNTVLDTMISLQYVVWGYLALEGELPKDFSEIADKGYIEKDKVYEAEKYSIDSEGIVHHVVWGSVFEPTPINRVKVEKVTNAEKNLYEDFKNDYQNFYQEFFDPVGVAVIVSDKIMLQTVILPLIDESEYNFLKAIFGGVSKDKISLVSSPDRESAFLFAATFSLDDALSFVVDEKYVTDPQEKAEKIAEIEKPVQEFLDLPENERVFDFVGDEIALGIGKDNKFNENNIADFDVFLALELKDPEKAQRIIKKAFEAISKEIGGSGFFALSSVEPVKNEYNGTSYYFVPTGFVNIYYTFIKDRFYLTISQLAMNKIIDGYQAGGSVVSEKNSRTIDFIDNKNNIMGLVEMPAIKNWFNGQTVKDGLTYDFSEALGQKTAYLKEAMALAEIMPYFKGDLSNVEKYYQNIPQNFLNLKFKVKNKDIYLDLNGENVSIYRIDSAYYQYEKIDREDRVDYSKVLESVDTDGVFAVFDKLGGLGLALNFTEVGLETKISFDNIYHQGGLDSRFVASKETFLESIGINNLNEAYLAYGVGFIMLLILFILYLRYRKR